MIQKALGKLVITVGPFLYLGQRPQTLDQAYKHKRTDLRLF